MKSKVKVALQTRIFMIFSTFSLIIKPYSKIPQVFSEAVAYLCFSEGSQGKNDASRNQGQNKKVCVGGG